MIPGNEVPNDTIITLPKNHTMGDSLTTYISKRVHELVNNLSLKQIIVLGSYRRDLTISKKEKRDKLENWQRPTAYIHDRTLEIHCFPGRAYVFHYANLIANYLYLNGRNPNIVKMKLPEVADCRNELETGGLKSLSTTQVAVVASGNNFLEPKKRNWIDHGTVLSRLESIGKFEVTWLAIKHSFWGDIAFHVGKMLAERGFELIIFIGKLGSLVTTHQPNITLVSGNESLIMNQFIKWDSIFKNTSKINHGRHITLPSVIQETVEWKDKHKNNFDFVDPEIGNFAAGVKEGGSRFSYLHIVSDNITKKYPEDLSNEREVKVRKRRREAYKKVNSILRATLNNELK